MIELGLSRVAQLLHGSNLPWRAVHIAGTNGKGSIAGYLSALLTAGDVRCGTFTSPHLVHRWDCITINNCTIQESIFQRVEDVVKRRNQDQGIGATEFELLTATAFEVFKDQKVEVGVVEVGMGGRLDATNVLENVLVSVIAKVGLDHQAILGNTIEEITREKAGILRPGVPCIVDASNELKVREVIQAHAEEIGTSARFAQPADVEESFPASHQHFKGLEPHQRSNLSCAVLALQETLSHIRPDVNLQNLFHAIPRTPQPGRLQLIHLPNIRPEKILLDGAHNPQSAAVLSTYVDREFRSQDGGRGRNVNWVVAASRGKDLRELFGCMIKPGDNVAAVRFSDVDGMPWVRSVKTPDLLEAVRLIPGIGASKDFRNLSDALRWASSVAPKNAMVIAGSLYLVSDVLRLVQEGDAS